MKGALAATHARLPDSFMVRHILLRTTVRPNVSGASLLDASVLTMTAQRVDRRPAGGLRALCGQSQPEFPHDASLDRAQGSLLDWSTANLVTSFAFITPARGINI